MDRQFIFTNTQHNSLDTSKRLVENLKGEGGKKIQELVEFVNDDALGDVAKEQIKSADVVWANDFSWGTESQEKLERVAFDSMTEGSCLVLYRPPLLMQELDWSSGAKINDLPTSWNPRLSFYLLVR